MTLPRTSKAVIHDAYHGFYDRMTVILTIHAGHFDFFGMDDDLQIVAMNNFLAKASKFKIRITKYE